MLAIALAAVLVAACGQPSLPAAPTSQSGAPAQAPSATATTAPTTSAPSVTPAAPTLAPASPTSKPAAPTIEPPTPTTMSISEPIGEDLATITGRVIIPAGAAIPADAVLIVTIGDVSAGDLEAPILAEQTIADLGGGEIAFELTYVPGPARWQSQYLIQAMLVSESESGARLIGQLFYFAENNSTMPGGSTDLAIVLD